MINIQKTISYWYMRYLLVTELYMVEKWERKMFHVIALILLAILTLFNHCVLVGGVTFMSQLYFYYTRDILNENLPDGDAVLGSSDL